MRRFYWLLGVSLFLLSACYPNNNMLDKKGEKMSELTPEQQKERNSYYCGRMGKSILKLPVRDAQLVEYHGVDYYAPGLFKDNDKWCDDYLSTFSIAREWPSLEKGQANVMKHNRLGQVVFTYNNVAQSAEDENRRRPDGLDRIKKTTTEMLWNMQSNTPLPDDYQPVITWRQDLELYQATAQIPAELKIDNNIKQMHAFWHENTQKQVDYVASCTQYKDGRSYCEGTYYLVEDDSLIVDITHTIELLPDWQKIIQASEQIYQSYVIKENE
ncbi:hypothetical protein GKC56_07080 [Neisseriaceae bacterium PsAf]|nr:hypothetical protein [Neisseriaceae bacterium PsAf]